MTDALSLAPELDPEMKSDLGQDHEKTGTGPDAPDANILVEANGETFDVVAIHGLGGDRQATWSKEHDSDSCWINDLLEDGRIIFYGYDTSETSPKCFTRQGIFEEATRLLETIRGLRTGEVATKTRPLVFLSHGVGGLIVKAALVLASRDPSRFEDVNVSTRVMIFFDYPHRPPNFHALQEHMLWHVAEVLDVQNAPRSRWFRHIKTLSETIHEVNGLFIHTRMLIQARVVNIASASSYTHTNKEGAFLRIPFERRIHSDQPYKSVTRLSPQIFEKIESTKSENWLAGQLDSHNFRTLQDLVSQAPPIYPLQNADFSTCVIPALDELLATPDDRILHVHSDVNGTRLSEYVCHYLMRTDPAQHNILYFQFDRHDVRFNNVASMLRYFVAQLGYNTIRTRSLILERVLTYTRMMQAFTLSDLLRFWRRYIADDSTEDDIYVIGGLEGCDGSLGQLLSELNSIMNSTEGRFRLVITTSAQTNTRISESMSNLPDGVYQEAEMDRDIVSSRGNCHPLALDVAELLHKDPRYYKGNIEGDISQAITACGDDTAMRTLLSTWLSCNDNPMRIIEEHLTTLQKPSPSLVFAAAISTIPLGRRNWAKSLLNWVLVSFRPLRAEELCLVSRLALGGEAEPECIQAVLRHLNGMLLLQNDEVKFGHPGIRAWLDPEIESGENQWWKHETVDNQHLDVLHHCLTNLCGPAGNPFPYCAQYWTQHYRSASASKVESVKAKVASLFENQIALSRWMELYEVVGDPFTQPGPRCQKPKAIAAHFGLDEIVEALKDIQGGYDSSALEEAARKGHTTTVAKLLPPPGTRFELSDPHLEGLVKAAAASGNEDILNGVLKRLPKENSQPDVTHTWLTDVLLKAFWLGNTDLLNATLDLGADVHVTVPFDFPMGLVEIAVMSNAPGIIEALLARDIDLTVGSGLGKVEVVASLVSAAFDNREMAKLLFDKKVLTPSSYDSRGFTALQLASLWGRPLITDFLLTFHGPVGDLVNPDLPTPLLSAAAWRKPRILQLLLDHDADTDAYDNFGNALHYSIRAGRLDMSRRLLKHNIDINLALSNNSPPLLHAIEYGTVEIVRLLLEHNADVEKREQPLEGEGRTPLLRAAGIGNKEVVKLLLDHGADVNARSDGWTPLYTAAYYGRVEAVRLLLDATEKPDLFAACGDIKWTALHAAYDTPEITSLLIDAGADPTKTYEAKASPMELASQNNQPEVLKLMLSRGYEDADILTTPLLRAVGGGHLEVARLLLEAGANVNGRNDWGSSLLSISMIGDDDRMVRTLLEFRPDLEAKTNKLEAAAVHHIAPHTPLSSLKLLVNAGADLRSLTKSKQSPLSTAVQVSNWDCAQYLLSKQAAVRAINIPEDAGTPLHLACRLGAPLSLVKMLVERGAEINFSCKGLVSTPLAQACIRRGDNFAEEKNMIIQYLVDDCHATLRGSEDWQVSPLHYASYACSAEIIALFTQRSADIQAADVMGRRPIHLACYNSVAAIKATASSEKDMTIRDKGGRLPLHCAVLSGQLDVVKHVLEKSKAAGLRVDEEDANGWTPLLWAAKAKGLFEWEDDGRVSFQEDIVRYLLENGADPMAKGTVQRETNEAQWCAKDVAAYHGASAVMEILAVHDDTSDLTMVGELGTGWCDFCMLRMCGPKFHCTECFDFDFCFKCHQLKDALHPPHNFIRRGPAETDTNKKENPPDADEGSTHERSEKLEDDDVLKDELEVTSDDEEVVSD